MQTVKRIIASLLTLVLLMEMMATAGAQGAPTSGLSISPTLSQFTLSAGQSTTVNITLKNATNGQITAQGTVNDFTSDGSTGNPKILTQPGVTSPNSIKKFVANLTNIPLDAGQQKTITVTIKPPAKTPPGAYYGIIRYRAVPAGVNAPAPGQVALTASVGTIVLVTVPGNLRELVQLSDVHVYRGAHDGTFFVKKPTKVGVEIKNFGNGFERPYGTVAIKNMFGKQVYSYQFNNPKQLGNVLPGSTRIFTSSVSGINQIGRYTVLASATYGDGSNVLASKKVFWYIPYWLILAVLTLLAILILLTVRLYVRYRRESHHGHRR